MSQPLCFAVFAANPDESCISPFAALLEDSSSIGPSNPEQFGKAFLEFLKNTSVPRAERALFYDPVFLESFEKSIDVDYRNLFGFHGLDLETAATEPVFVRTNSYRGYQGIVVFKDRVFVDGFFKAKGGFRKNPITPQSYLEWNHSKLTFELKHGDVGPWILKNLPSRKLLTLYRGTFPEELAFGRLVAALETADRKNALALINELVVSLRGSSLSSRRSETSCSSSQPVISSMLVSSAE